MNKVRFLTVVVMLSLYSTCSVWTNVALAEVTAEESEGGVVVKIDGELFAEYLKQPGHQPCVWPIIGPTGKAMTRAYPIGPHDPDETTDHPHHHSLWFIHGDVNGRDFWTDRSITADRNGNRVVHREFVEVENLGSKAKVVTRNDWLADDEKICEDERTLVFGTDGDNRWIDFTVTIKATEGDVTLGETKEGTFGVRVADAIRVDARQGGRLVNSNGLVDGAVWGMHAEWIDNSGPIDGEVVGIAMMSHPSNHVHPTRWHARSYGMLTANPFGEHEFPDSDGPKQAAYTIAQGDELTLRYRVVAHRGDAEEANIAAAYRAFAGE